MRLIRPKHGAGSADRRSAALPLLAGLLIAALVGAVIAIVRNIGSADDTAPQPASASAGARQNVLACMSIVEGLSPRQRLAQRLMVGVDAAKPAAAEELVRSAKVGGIFLGGDATALLRDGALARVQRASDLPLAIAVDDEGGRVQRIDTLDGQLPSARQMAATRSPEQVRELGRTRGQRLAARGVTMDFAPTVDLGGQPARAVIGDRAFSTDPAVVTTYAGAFADGLRDAGVQPVLKHFPGHGRADGDSHRGRVTTPPLDDLRATDLRPYADLLGGPRRAAVMVGHLDVPGLTGDLPTSLTPATYALLRDVYHFDGLVVTDDLAAMKAVSQRFPLPDAVVTALAAGADMALWSTPAPPGPVLDVLEGALASGRFDAAASDRAVARVLAAKGVCAP